VRGQGRATLAIIGLGIGVKTGAKLPDISTRDALRAALAAGRAIVHAPPAATPSGAQSEKVIKELGLAGKVPVIHKAGLAGGVAAIASGEAEYGIFPKSEIVAFDGVTLIGSLPPALQLNIVYGAAVTTASAVAGPAADFIQFLIAPESRKVWNACGFDPPSR
jgi:molybdate transport system substrate-binding protein